jgi:hypothetical protein
VFPIPVAPAGILPRYDAACVAVAKAKTIDEVREIAFSAEALRAYARQARNRQLELDAAEIRIRADRRVGELMAGQRIVFGVARPPGANQYQHRVETKPDAPPTLAEAGIDKNQAHRSRSLYAMPNEAFEERLKAKRHRHDRRVVLAPDEAKVDAGGGDVDPMIVIAPGERTREALAAENEKLSRLVATLRREVKMWKERAEAAGWKETADA